MHLIESNPDLFNDDMFCTNTSAAHILELHIDRFVKQNGCGLLYTMGCNESMFHITKREYDERMLLNLNYDTGRLNTFQHPDVIKLLDKYPEYKCWHILSRNPFAINMVRERFQRTGELGDNIYANPAIFVISGYRYARIRRDRAELHAELRDALA